MSAPNFFLVGASKAGTTSLYNYLAQHPQIFMSPIKEPHFHADEVRKENFEPEKQQLIEKWERRFREYLRGPMPERFASGPVADWQDYLQLFRNAGDRPAIGEASPCYLWSKTAPGNIAARFPDAKILMILRNPVERAFAQHLHTLSFASRPISFREHIDAALEAKSARIGELYPFLEFGMYAGQVERYLNLFPREQIRIFLYDDFLGDPRSMLRDIFTFLGVDEVFVPDLRERHMTAHVPRSFGVNRLLRQSGAWTLGKRHAGRRLRRLMFRPRASMSMNAEDRARLVALYADDVRKLSSLLGRDLSAWIT